MRILYRKVVPMGDVIHFGLKRQYTHHTHTNIIQFAPTAASNELFILMGNQYEEETNERPEYCVIALHLVSRLQKSHVIR